MSSDKEEVAAVLKAIEDTIWQATGSALLSGERCKKDDVGIIRSSLCVAGNQVAWMREQLASLTPSAGRASLSRESFDAAFIAAIEKQAGFEPHRPGWKPLIDFVWEELGARGLLLSASRAGWRWVESEELPQGPPVEAGTTLYTFKGAHGHWEYELPALPDSPAKPG